MSLAYSPYACSFICNPSIDRKPYIRMGDAFSHQALRSDRNGGISKVMSSHEYNALCNQYKSPKTVFLAEGQIYKRDGKTYVHEHNILGGAKEVPHIPKNNGASGK